MIAEIEDKIQQACDWALTHSLVVHDPVQNGLSHAPFALHPTKLPRKLYEHVQRLQPLFNRLVHQISLDTAFLTEALDDLATSDDFIKSCYDIYKAVSLEGSTQRIVFGIHRSDYLMHVASGKEPTLQQVELNTIASSFASLSSKVAELHKFLASHDNAADGAALAARGALPENPSLLGLSKGLASAWRLYGSKSAVVLMVVQPGEKNIFDQRLLEFSLFENHGIKLLRKTLSEVNEKAKLLGEERKLFIGGHEIAVVYFRAGYSPADYPTAKEWQARLLMERSHAIKCPNIAYHLVGSKKIQQILAQPNVLERFLPNALDCTLMRSCFTGLYPLDQTKDGLGAYAMALDHPEKYVMKPQREGGGNNIYGEDIRTTLQRLGPSERNAFILMDLIRSPTTKNIMIRRGKATEAEVVSELGIYGVWISEGETVHINEHCGHLLRTKSSTSMEGGVAAGFAVLDSPLLI